MPFRNVLLVSCVVVGGFAGSAGCASSDGATPEPALDCNAVDYASYKTGGPTVSLKADVMPVFGLSCVAGECHNPKVHKAQLDLGPPCKYQTATKTCVFPDAVDPNSTSTNPPGPLTADVMAAVYASLTGVAATVHDPAVLRVVPGDAKKSFLVQKLANTHGKQGYTACKSEDDSHKVTSDPCGDSMPLGATDLCQQSPDRFLTVVRWIEQGAKNN